jgi:hypothetical protein
MFRRVLPVGIAILAVLSSGVVHGLWTDRWTGEQRASVSAAQLDRVPLKLGDWQGKNLELDPRQKGPVAGYLYRRYTNQRTGAAVTVVLVSGRPGPVAIHTPDVCYVASGYQSGPAATVAPPLGPSLKGSEFKTAVFVKNKVAEQTRLRVFWSWNADGVWQVAESPRLAFAKYPVLFKLHIARELSGTADSLEQEPCIELMQLLLPEFQQVVISPS